MKLPVEMFLEGINEKKIYYFSSTKIKTSIPHYFICVLKAEKDTLLLVCCTSDRDGKRRKRAEILNLHSTLIWIKPDASNGFAVDTFVDCNDIFDYSVTDFKKMYEQNVIEYKGEISETYYEQILRGLLNSPSIVENIKNLIKTKIIDY